MSKWPPLQQLGYVEATVNSETMQLPLVYSFSQIVEANSSSYSTSPSDSVSSPISTAFVEKNQMPPVVVYIITKERILSTQVAGPSGQTEKKP